MRKLAVAVTFAAVMLAGRASAEAPKTYADLALYDGADREQVLYAGAKKEGAIKWYVSLVDPVPADMVTAFKKKYPGLDVQFTAATDTVMGTRIISEYQAGRRDIDVITVTGVGPSIVAVTGGQKWFSPSLADYPIGEQGRDPSGLFVSITQYARTIAYNTSQVPPSEVPTKWEDLLAPRWKGRIAFSNSTTVGPMMVGGLIELWGRDRTVDFVKQLAKQDVAVLTAGPAAVASQVAGGDFDACYCAVHHVRALQAQGAPIALASLGDTLFAPVQTTQLPTAPPNPNGALLFTDFLLAPDGGQAVLKADGYLPTNPKVAGHDPFLADKKLWVLSPERQDKGLADWSKIFRTISR